MNDDPLFEPSEIDAATGVRVSASNLGEYADWTLVDPALDALENADNAEQFYRAAAALMFHARHLHPSTHAAIAKRLLRPFKRPSGRPAAYERNAYIEDAIAASGGSFFMLHEWARHARVQMIAAIAERYGLTDEAARKAYDKAKRSVAKRRAKAPMQLGKKDGAKNP